MHADIYTEARGHLSALFPRGRVFHCALPDADKEPVLLTSPPVTSPAEPEVTVNTRLCPTLLRGQWGFELRSSWLWSKCSYPLGHHPGHLLLFWVRFHYGSQVATTMYLKGCWNKTIRSGVAILNCEDVNTEHELAFSFFLCLQVCWDRHKQLRVPYVTTRSCCSLHAFLTSMDQENRLFPLELLLSRTFVPATKSVTNVSSGVLHLPRNVISQPGTHPPLQYRHRLTNSSLFTCPFSTPHPQCGVSQGDKGLILLCIYTACGLQIGFQI